MVAGNRLFLAIFCGRAGVSGLAERLAGLGPNATEAEAGAVEGPACATCWVSICLDFRHVRYVLQLNKERSAYRT